MYSDVQEWVKTCKQYKLRASLQYAEPLKSLTVSHLWQRVGMDITYMHKMAEGFHHLFITSDYLWAGQRQGH
jgi:hypothetical protein